MTETGRPVRRSVWGAESALERPRVCDEETEVRRRMLDAGCQWVGLIADR